MASLGAGLAVPLVAQRVTPAAVSIAFTDVTQAAGVRFSHVSGAFGKKHLPETMGAGVAVLDVDGDGRQDLFFVNSRTWPGRAG